MGQAALPDGVSEGAGEGGDTAAQGDEAAARVELLSCELSDVSVAELLQSYRTQGWCEIFGAAEAVTSAGSASWPRQWRSATSDHRWWSDVAVLSRRCRGWPNRR